MAVVVLSIASPTSAHLSSTVYPIVEVLPGEIDLTDGSVADWEEIASDATLVL